MKALMLCAVMALSGCEFMRAVAPHTTKGFEEGGIVGAVAGAATAMLVACQTVDGVGFTLAIDVLAAELDEQEKLESIRNIRRSACAIAQGLSYLDMPTPIPRPEGTP